jgi:hypothetical protein
VRLITRKKTKEIKSKKQLLKKLFCLKKNCRRKKIVQIKVAPSAIPDIIAKKAPKAWRREIFSLLTITPNIIPIAG